ncbi:MAG: HEAT repeat domain-containing protein [Gammaproteobacteria bacterium]|nr:MAG: HEAT repeat domain-containing protein [Gammaproteobacteria bacterium]
MRIIKTLALTLIVAISGLAILQLPDFFREAATVSDLSSAMRKTMSDGRQQPSQQPGNTWAEAAESNRSLPLAQVAPDPPATATAVPQFIDWMQALYPQLVRIAELENQPVDIALVELLPMLNDGDPAVRLAALEAVGDMTTASVLPVLLMALSDPDPRVRIAALEALAAHEDRAAAGSIEPYLYDENPKVRLAAIEALSDLVAETAVHSLAGLLSDPEVPIRQQAVTALGDIGGENAVMYLLQARYDLEPGIRANVANILSELESSNR